METVAEAPLLPAHFAIFYLKARMGLGDGERRERGAVWTRRQWVEIGILAGDGSIAVGIEKVDDLSGCQVHVRHYAFNRMRVEIASGSGVVGERADNAAVLSARQREVSGGPGHDLDGAQVCNAAFFHGMPPARIGAHDAVC